MGINMKEMSLPLEEFAEGEEMVTRRCTSFGEADIMITNDPDVFGTTDIFKCFYNRFIDDSTIWFAYHDDDKDYENQFKFHLDSWRDDEYGTNSMKEIITPRILPVNFTSRKGALSFEFY